MDTNNRTERKQNQTRLIRRVVLVLLTLIGLAVLGFIIYVSLLARALDGLAPMFNSPICDPQNPAGIEEIAQIKLPPSFSNLESHCGGLQGWIANAKFDIDPDELDLFLQSTSIRPPLSSTELPTRPNSIHFPQGAEGIESYLYGSNQRPEWFEEVIVDTSDPSRWVVYFTLLAG